MLQVDVLGRKMKCSDNTGYCPSGVKDFCPSDFVDPPPPPGEVTTNPLGECSCEGEIFLSQGCQYAFACDSESDIGGEYIYCPEVSALFDVKETAVCYPLSFILI